LSPGNPVFRALFYNLIVFFITDAGKNEYSNSNLQKPEPFKIKKGDFA
jgi:hypothetical protein